MIILHTNVFFQALRDTDEATGRGRPLNDIRNGENELEDSEEEGEELLKQVKDRKQSVAKLNMNPQEKKLLQRLNSEGDGNFLWMFIYDVSIYVFDYALICI